MFYTKPGTETNKNSRDSEPNSYCKGNIVWETEATIIPLRLPVGAIDYHYWLSQVRSRGRPWYRSAGSIGAKVNAHLGARFYIYIMDACN